MPALADVAAELLENIETALVFDSFPDHAQPQCLRHLDRRADHDAVGRIVLDRPHEGLVDLNLSCGKSLQVALRRLAGAVVVDRYRYPGCLDALQRLDRLLDFCKRGGFGDLENHA